MNIDKSFRQLLYKDHEARRRNDYLAAGCALLYYLFMVYVMDRNQHQVSGELFFVLIGTMLICDLAHCYFARSFKSPKLRSEWTDGKFLIARRQFAIPSVTFLLCLPLVPFPTIEASIVRRRLRRALAQGDPRAVLSAVARVAKEAQREGLRPSPDTIELFISSVQHKTFSEVQPTTGDWNALQSVASYRTTLPEEGMPDLSQVHPVAGLKGANIYIEFMFMMRGLTRFAFGYIGPLVPIERGAIAISLEKTVPSGLQSPQWLCIPSPGAPVAIDSVRFRNVIFIDCEVNYGGSDVELENVYFYRCTFEIRDNHAGRSLMDHLLMSYPVNFKQLKPY
jgi:hypothetical protein